MARRKNLRLLSPSEHALWQAVTHKVTPLPGAPVAPVKPPPPLPLADPKAAARPQARPKKPAVPPPPKTKTPPPTSPFDEGDPKAARRVARGRMPIAATLDLHGLTQTQAETRLRTFLEFAAVRGARTVLVITGKGAPDATPIPFEEAPRGILRQRFLEWVQAPPLRGLIASVRPAHQKHGGRGAFYVFLKRA